MSAAIQIGNTVKRQAVEALADGIAVVLTAAFETHADQETTREALRILSNAAVVTTPVHITDSTFRMKT